MHCYLTGMAFKSLSQGLCHPLCCVAEEPLSFHLICSTLIHSTPHPKFPEPTSLPRYTSFHYFPQVFPPLAHLAPTSSQSWLTPFPLLSCPEHHCFQLSGDIGFPGLGPLAPSLTQVCQLCTHSSSALCLLSQQSWANTGDRG